MRFLDVIQKRRPLPGVIFIRMKVITINGTTLTGYITTLPISTIVVRVLTSSDSWLLLVTSSYSLYHYKRDKNNSKLLTTNTVPFTPK